TVDDSRRSPDWAGAYMTARSESGGRLRVLGHVSAGHGGGAEGQDTFVVDFPERCAVVASHGPAAGSLDGRAYAGPVRVDAGRHAYRPGRDEDTVAVIWAQAAERDFTPFASGVRTP